VEFEIAGQRFTALNGGPEFKFTEAVSLQVDCADQDEVDYYWERLSEGGEQGPCGWLKDKYGLSWQVVSSKAADWFGDEAAPAKKQAAWEAMMQMGKLDLAALQKTYEEA
ncbi:MAG: VOC family protein, partial [Nocardioidaceae bacterium]